MGKQIKKKSSKKGSKKGKRIIKKNNASSDTSDMRELLNTNSSEGNMMGAPMQQQMMNPMQQAMEIDPLHANSFVPMNNMQNGNNMNSNLLSPAQMAQNIGSLANLSKLNLNQSGMQDYQFSEMSQMSMAPSMAPPMNQFNGMPPMNPHMNQFNGMPPMNPHMNQFNGMSPMNPHMNQFNGMPPMDSHMNQLGSMNSVNFNNLAKLHSIKQL